MPKALDHPIRRPASLITSPDEEVEMIRWLQLTRWTVSLLLVLLTGCATEIPAPGLVFPDDGGGLPGADTGDMTSDSAGPSTDGRVPLDDVTPADGTDPLDAPTPVDLSDPPPDVPGPDTLPPLDAIEDDGPPPPEDSDGDGVPDDEDCAPLDPLIHPGATEICNGEDDDCDAAIDEDLEDLVCGEGVCQSTVPACAFGVPVACTPKDLATEEVCDALDNDCDGEVDEGFEVLTCGVGACETSVYSCQEGAVTTCTPLEPTDEVCDGLDNDCDGEIDEELADIPCGVGVCATAVPGCVDGEVPTCEPLDAAAEEICDGLDNDCNGEIDEGLGETTCGEGPCETTVANCVDGVPQACVPPVSVGTCDAPPAYCNQTTTGTDACGVPCTKVGPAYCYIVHAACLTSNPGAPTNATHCTTPKDKYNCGLTCQEWPNIIGADCTYCVNIHCKPKSGLDEAQFYCANYPAPPTP
jgi:hypothetical protein